MSGYEFAANLRSSGVECEMSDANRVVLMFSSANKIEDFERAEIAILFVRRKSPIAPEKYPVIKPAVHMPVHEAMFLPQKIVPLKKASGEVCAGLNAPCPPCVPLVMPGEIIDHNVMAALKQYGVKRVAILDRTKTV